MRGGGGDVQARADRGEHRGRSFCRQHSRPVPALPLLLHRRRCLTALCNGDVGAALPTRRNRSSAAHRVHSKEKGRKKNKKKTKPKQLSGGVQPSARNGKNKNETGLPSQRQLDAGTHPAQRCRQQRMCHRAVGLPLTSPPLPFLFKSVQSEESQD